MKTVSSFLPRRGNLLLAALLALSAMLWSCEPTKRTRPDLRPSEIKLDAQNRLIVTMVNEGDSIVPENVGSLHITIDGKSIGGYVFQNLADQSWRQPGGSITIPTNFRLKGSNRLVSVVVDSKDEIIEHNEFQNSNAFTLVANAMTGPDFVISDLSVNAGGNLVVQVKNAGNATNPAGLQLKIRVIVNETVAGDFTPTPGAIAANGTWNFTPAPAVAVPANATVRVLVNTPNWADETDNTNGVRQEVLPSGPSLTIYNGILANPEITNHMIWQSSSGDAAYPSWSAGQKNDLNNALLALEKDENPSLAAPPVLVSERISKADAWKIYLAHAAQSLWAEAHHIVPWSLTSFTPDQRKLILSGKNLMNYDAGADKYYFSTMGNLTAWNPKIAYEFLQSLGILKGDIKATVYKLTDFFRGHFIHISGSDTYLDLYGYAGPPAFDKVVYPLPGKSHVTAGCWGTTGMYHALLRTVNIPVSSSTIPFHNGTHSRPEFPSLGLSLSHGDDPYTIVLLPSGVAIPSAQLFYTNTEMNNYFLSPPELFCDGADCNTPGEQASWAASHYYLQRCYDFKGDYLLHTFATGGEPKLIETLTGTAVGGSILIWGKPLFTPEERTTMVQGVKDRLTEIGDGNIETGKSIVIARWAKFVTHK